jgi:hypothetical protein
LNVFIPPTGDVSDVGEDPLGSDPAPAGDVPDDTEGKHSTTESIEVSIFFWLPTNQLFKLFCSWQNLMCVHEWIE